MSSSGSSSMSPMSGCSEIVHPDLGGVRYFFALNDDTMHKSLHIVALSNLQTTNADRLFRLHLGQSNQRKKNIDPHGETWFCIVSIEILKHHKF